MTLKTVLKNFLNHVETFETRKSLGDDPYEQEFQKLKELTEKLKHDPDYACTQGLRDVNHRKNRYKDILPYDYTRVILSEYPGVPGSDYINANHIKGASGSLAYIASQGPLPNTVVDFWRMIWECEVQVIVMACNERESGKYKCECYWPHEDEKRQYGNITVELVKWRQVCPDFLVRTLRTRYGNDERTVCQFHYASWPDHGVPTSVQPILELVRLVRDCQASEALPVLVHCSAGCGRTGTICAIDYVWGLMRMGKLTENFSLFQIISDMRRQRIAMVQTKEQYVLVHRAVAALFEQQLRVIDTHTYENLDEDGEPLILKEMKQEEEDVYEEIYIQDLPEKKDKDEKEIDKESNKMHEDDRERSPGRPILNQKNESRSNKETENKSAFSKESSPESIESQPDSSLGFGSSSGCDASREDESESEQDFGKTTQRNTGVLIKLRKEESFKRLITDWNQGSEHSAATESKEKTNQEHSEFCEKERNEYHDVTSNYAATNDNITNIEVVGDGHIPEGQKPCVLVKVRSFSASEAANLGAEEKRNQVLTEDVGDDSVFEDCTPSTSQSPQQKVTLPKKTSHVERIVGKATVIRRPSIAKLKALFEKSLGTDVDPSPPAEQSRRRRPLSRSHSHHLARGLMEASANFSLNTVPIKSTTYKESKPQVTAKHSSSQNSQQGRDWAGTGVPTASNDQHSSSSVGLRHHDQTTNSRSDSVHLQARRSEHESIESNLTSVRQKSLRSHTTLQRSASEISRQRSHWYVSEVNHEHAIDDTAADVGRLNNNSKLSAVNDFNLETDHSSIGIDNNASSQLTTWYAQLDEATDVASKAESSPKPTGTLERLRDTVDTKETTSNESPASCAISAPQKPSLYTKPNVAQIEVIPPALPIKKKVLRVSATDASRRGSISYSAPLKLKEKSIVTPLVVKQSSSSAEKRAGVDTIKETSTKNSQTTQENGNPPILPVKKVIGRHGSMKTSVIYQDLTVCSSNNRSEISASDVVGLTKSTKSTEYPSGQYTNVNVTAKKNIELIENTLEQHPRGGIIDLTSRQSYIAENQAGANNSEASSSKNVAKISLPKAVSCEFVTSTGEERIMIAAKQASGYEAIWVEKGTSQPPKELGSMQTDDENSTSLGSLSSTETLGKSLENITSTFQDKVKVKPGSQEEQDADRNLLLHSPPPRSKRTHVTKSNSKSSSAPDPVLAVTPNVPSEALSQNSKNEKCSTKDLASDQVAKEQEAPVMQQDNEKPQPTFHHKELSKRSRTLVTSSSSSNLLDLNHSSDHHMSHSSLFSRTAFELNLETEIPLLNITSPTKKSSATLHHHHHHRNLQPTSSNDANNQNKKVAKASTIPHTSGHYQIYDIPSNLLAPSQNTHQHLQSGLDAKRPYQSNAEYEYLYPLQRSASTPHYEISRGESTSKPSLHQHIFETWTPRRSREDEYQILSGNVHHSPQSQSDTFSVSSNQTDIISKNTPKLIGNGPPKPPRTYDYMAPPSQTSDAKKSSVYQSPPKLDGGRLIVSVASPKRNASRTEAKFQNETNQKSPEMNRKGDDKEKLNVSIFSSNNPLASQSSGLHKSQDNLSASRSSSSVPNGAGVACSLSVKPSDNPVYCVIDRQAKELQRAKSLKHDKSHGHSVFQQRKVQEYPMVYQQRSQNVSSQKTNSNSPYKSPPVIHLYENVYSGYGVTFPGPNRKERFTPTVMNHFGKNDRSTSEDHSLMRLQSDSSVYAVLRGVKNPPSVVMNRPAQPPSYSQVIKLKNESKLYTKDVNLSNLEEEMKHRKQRERTEVATKPVAPPRTKRQAQAKQNFSKENPEVDWDRKGHLSHQKNQTVKKQVLDDESPDSESEGIPSVPAKTKGAYETLGEKSEGKKTGSSDSGSRGGTLSRAFWAKLTQLTKIGSRSGDPFESDVSKPDTDGVISGEATEQMEDSGKLTIQSSISRSDMIFPNRIQKPAGPRESPKQWTQV